MKTATCQCGCGQDWMVMPGDLESSPSPACQLRNERDRKAAERAKRQELRDAKRFGVSTANGKSTIRRPRR